MGDVVLINHETGRELRFTHEDFKAHGKRRGSYGLFIPFGPRKETFTGGRQYGVYHTEEVEGEESSLGGHNARFGDDFGVWQMFSSTRNNKPSVHEGTFVNGNLTIIHEVGGSGTIEGQVKDVPEQIETSLMPKVKKENSSSWIDRLRRK